MGRVGTFFKILGAIGFVVTVIAGVIEAIVGAGQSVLPFAIAAPPVQQESGTDTGTAGRRNWSKRSTACNLRGSRRRFSSRRTRAS